MKTALCSPGRLVAAAVCAALATTALAADKPAANNVQLPQQVLPTGAEDAAQAVPNARSAAAAVASDNELLVRELLEMTSESDEGLQTVQLADGTTMVDLQGRFMSVAVATPTHDGGVVVGCYTGKEGAEKALEARAKIDKSLQGATQQAPKLLIAPSALEEK